MRFRFLRDPMFLFCLILYFLNRWVLEPLHPGTFFPNHLNDLICIPVWVPIMISLARWLRIRPDDSPPTTYEIVVPLILWSVIFELWLPVTSRWKNSAIADPLDVVYYVLGAIVAAVVWRLEYPDRPRSPDERKEGVRPARSR